MNPHDRHNFHTLYLTLLNNWWFIFVLIQNRLFYFFYNIYGGATLEILIQAYMNWALNSNSLIPQ